MANLRIDRFNLISSTQVEVVFTHHLDTFAPANVSITGLGGTPDLSVLATSVYGVSLTITTRPMVSKGYYKITLSSTENSTIRGLRGQSFLEDGSTNVIYFVGIEEENDLRDAILDDVPDIYNKNPGDLVYDAIEASAREINTLLHRLGEVRSANYVSVDVVDESKTRGNSAFDRLDNEGAFQLLRVGSTATGTTTTSSISFDSFPANPVSLQQIEVDEEEVSNTSNDANGFNGLIITVSKFPVIIVSSVVLVRGSEEFTYNIPLYKYGLLEDKYDSTNAYPAFDIENNQIKLSSSAVGPDFPLPQGSDKILISYTYKRLGREVSASSVSVFSIESVVREPVPAVSTSFFLKNAPIVDGNNTIPSTGGITWLDPAQNFDSGEKHPAFTTELVFSISNFPQNPGEYTVNYETGQVIVFGVDGTNTDGTTLIPPVATYNFRNVYQDGLDYTFSEDLDEIASSPNRDLRGEDATISFEYEDTFAEGTDFNFASHVEVIDERVENRLIETIGLKTQNFPVNEVFRIFNETTGEIYTTTRISGNEVFFTAINPPRLVDITREAARFSSSLQSQIVVTDELTVSGKSFVVFRVELEHTKISAATEDFIGASFNSSLQFSESDVFVIERFFEQDDTLAVNLSRLQNVGDYMVDYVNGVAYVAVNSGSSTAIGDANYKYGIITTRKSHIIRANDVYRSPGVNLQHAKIFNVGTITDNTVSLLNLNSVGEKTIDDSAIVVSSSDTITVSQDIFRLRSIFQITDLKTQSSPINFASGATVSSSSPTVITLNSNGVIVEDTFLTVQSAGTRKYVNADRIEDLYNAGIGQLVSGLSAIDSYSGVNYFIEGSDGYVSAAQNRLYFPSSTSASAGAIVDARYRAKLNGGAAVLVDYSIGDVFIDYTYTPDEILITYEYGDNVLDWSISNALDEGEEYFVSYRYGALRNSLRDNFGILSSVPEILNIPDNLDREVYRHAVAGTLQSFPKGPTIPSIEGLGEAMTQITPNITEEVFEEWILDRDKLYREELAFDADTDDNLPTFAPGKFGNGLLLDKPTQTATLPTGANISFGEGTWEGFITTNWKGIENDATLTFDTLFDGNRNPDKVYIGAENNIPSSIPFTLNKNDAAVLGRPSALHNQIGYFIWLDTSANKWRFRARAPISEERVFSGSITTEGKFHNVKIATTADGYDGYDGYEVNEINDVLRSIDKKISYAFVVDAYDSMNMAFDAYDSYSGGGLAGFDGIDFTSDKLYYFLDTGVENSKCRMSLFKDGDGFLKFRIFDENQRKKELSADISDWENSSTHHVAISWKTNSIEMQDEMHLFIDGREVPNTYRFGGYLAPPDETLYLDTATEILASSSDAPTIGGSDLSTTLGSNIVVSASSTFTSNLIGKQFLILDDTDDGDATQSSPYVFVKDVLGQNQLELEIGPAGSGTDYNAQATLSSVKFSVNSITSKTVSDPQIEIVRVFSRDAYGEETELFSPNTVAPDYEFVRDGYEDYVNVFNGVPEDGDVLLRTYGLRLARCKQLAYVWSNLKINILKTIMPIPTSVAKIVITPIISRRATIDSTSFILVATTVGTDIVPVFVSNLEFCQPSNSTTGRRISAYASGDNIDFSAINQVILIGDTTDGYGSEILTFTSSGTTQTTTRFFTSLTDVIASFTPIDPTKVVGSVELREAVPLTVSENGGDAAIVRLSVQQQAGVDGYTTIGTGKFTDIYARFGAEDISKTIVITSPSSIAGPYTISDVSLDPSSTVKDSNTITLNTTWADGYTDIEWKMISTSYSDSGFANGLITLEIANSGGQPFLLRSCWYEIDFPTYLTIPWMRIPETLYFGSDKFGQNQANAVIDEMRLLDELSLDTGRGEATPSSGRSITTDSAALTEYTTSSQTLGLFHFNDTVVNEAEFFTRFAETFRQSENSVNSNFGQSIIFNRPAALTVNNASIFQNNAGTIEFWISPILDTFNDPTNRFYIDLTPEQQIEVVALSALTIILPVRARSISSVVIEGDDTNYFIGGSLSNDGRTITLGQSLPSNNRNTTITYVPITSQGDRFSIYKDVSGNITLFVKASGNEFQIKTPAYWKKNTWHRVFVGWDLNNTDNQDTLIMMVDGTEGGIIRYGTGLLYGTGVQYGQPDIWGSADVGTTASRGILSDINLTDIFNTINIGADFTGQLTALARMDNIRFSSDLRTITRLGGSGPGQLIGKDLLFTSNTNAALPVIEDGLTRLLLDFDTTAAEVEHLAKVRSDSGGIFDFFVEIIDTFELADTTLAHKIITALVNRIKPAHTRAFVSFTK